ncbi:uncharacterized protein L203_100609 [Cryptococcus depauperatus CBS 7841]|uniref:Uncharacterized protein n=1 Tax=Cryptococcus depauperatus CBS 7841 TaxID=1295531 RepID=A0A1E3IYZ4_9TREE|nr:hypothetical protein L203_00395 [Cryptococcus depauperatus CBS 7841]
MSESNSTVPESTAPDSIIDGASDSIADRTTNPLSTANSLARYKVDIPAEHMSAWREVVERTKMLYNKSNGRRISEVPPHYINPRHYGQLPSASSKNEE